jgi:hypothetical protein
MKVNPWHYTGRKVAWPDVAIGPEASKDGFSGIRAGKVVFAKKREKTAHKFICWVADAGYSEISGQSNQARQAL